MSNPSGIAAAAIASLALLLPTPALRAETVVSTRAGAGLLVGMAREIVFNPEAPSRSVLSELDWPMLPLMVASTGLEVSAGTGFAASLEVSAGIPARSGTMTDRDYLNDVRGEVTHFSSHDCYAEHALFLDARGGFRFSVRGLVGIEPYLALSLFRLRWSARDGYLQYPPESVAPFTPWDASAPRAQVYGTGIAYELLAFYPAVGVQATYRLLGVLDARLSLALSPFVVCRDMDSHYFRLVDFHESFAGGFVLEPGLGADWHVSERARLCLDVAVRHMAGLVGDSYDVQSGVEGWDTGAGTRSPIYRDGAGVAVSFLRASVAFLLSY